MQFDLVVNDDSVERCFLEHAEAAGKDKLANDKIVELLESGMSVIDIHRKVEVARNTIFTIRRELLMQNKRLII
jgi:hypothetical protein